MDVDKEITRLTEKITGVIGDFINYHQTDDKFTDGDVFDMHQVIDSAVANLQMLHHVQEFEMFAPTEKELFKRMEERHIFIKDRVKQLLREERKAQKEAEAEEGIDCDGNCEKCDFCDEEDFDGDADTLK